MHVVALWVLLAARGACLVASIRVEYDKRTVALLEEASVHEQARTDVHAQREAFATFHDLVAPWTYSGINGSEPLTCGNQTYTGPLVGIGSGAHGVTVMLHRAQSSGSKVVAKFWRGMGDENLNHECEILKRLARKGVTNVLTCEAACKHNGHTMIVVAPFIEERHQMFTSELQPDFFDSPAALRRAVKETFRIGFSMLAVEVANLDQGQNILYLANGSAMFIDMGMAAYLREDLIPNSRVGIFLQELFAKVPTSWWKDGRATEILREVMWPPSGDFTDRIRQQITTHGGSLNGLPTMPPKPSPRSQLSLSDRIRSLNLLTLAGVGLLWLVFAFGAAYVLCA